MSDSNTAIIGVKVNQTWTQMPTDDPDEVNCPAAYRCGGHLYQLFVVPDGYDLWRECDDGMGDELINETEEEYSLFDGDRFYTAARLINEN